MLNYFPFSQTKLNAIGHCMPGGDVYISLVPERTLFILFICSAYCAEGKNIHKHFILLKLNVLSENNHLIFLVTLRPLHVLHYKCPLILMNLAHC